jgi:hypothetical protein
MIFETLHESSERGELVLLDGGYMRWHLRRDNTITIYEIISQRPGTGQALLARLPTGHPVVAKCPQDLAANAWYARRGFQLARTETTPSGRTLNVWRRDA